MEETIGGILLERGASFEDENFTPRVLGVDYGIGSLDNYIEPRKSSLLGSFSSRFYVYQKYRSVETREI